MLVKGEVLGVVDLPNTSGGRPQQRLAVWDGDGIVFIRRVKTHSGDWEPVVVDPSFRIPASALEQVIDILMPTQARFIEQGEKPTPEQPTAEPPPGERDGDHGPH